ncbi:hypothetical protein [Amycolatopsis sp. NPDC051102]|uniref:hypothetical protein n=1 Tax=Amycolatopsis sp. NPDC051102 TaxID=3155163 RepID=UPI00344433EE
MLNGTAYATAVSVDAVSSAKLAGLAFVVLAVAGRYRRQLRPPRPGRFLLGALAAVPLLDLAGFLQLRLGGDGRGALLAALGFLLPAGYERSWSLAAVAGVFVLVVPVFLPPVRGAFAVLPRGPVTAADTA